MIKRKGAIKRIAMLLVVATLLSALTIPALAAPVTDNITVPAGQESFSIDIYVNELTAYAGIEFALTISNESAATFTSFTPVLSGATASPFMEKDGQHYFGFYAASNVFPTGEKLAGKLQFTGYTGNQAFTVKVEKMTVIRIEDNKSVKTENESPSHVFSVQRAGVIPTYYTVTFDPNGGTRISGGELVQTLPEGGAAVAPVVTRSGYTFAGWYKDRDLTTPWNFDEDTVIGNLTLYAKWDAIPGRFTVSFDTGDGSEVDPVSVVSGDKLAEPAEPTRSGYTFGGWYSDEALTTAYDFNAIVTGDMTLYAKWREVPPVNYTVTFNSNGGSAVTSQTVTSGQAATKPADPTREGYTFDGWHSDESLTRAYSFSTPVTGNLTLYAKWTEDAKEDSHTPYIKGYDDGTFKPEDNITRAEAAIILYRLVDDENKDNANVISKFSDMKQGTWYYHAVAYLENKGLIKGYTDNTYGPGKNITRAEFITLMARFKGLDISSPGNTTFKDVTNKYWAYNAVTKVADQGWIEGRGDGNFVPEDNIKRAEAVTAVNRMLDRTPVAENIPTECAGIFSDVTDSSKWYYAAVIEAATTHNYTLDENGNEIWYSWSR